MAQKQNPASEGFGLREIHLRWPDVSEKENDCTPVNAGPDDPGPLPPVPPIEEPVPPIHEPDRPVVEPDPDRLPDEEPLPNPDENPDPPQRLGLFDGPSPPALVQMDGAPPEATVLE